MQEWTHTSDRAAANYCSFLSEFDSVKTIRSSFQTSHHGIPVGITLLRWAKAKGDKLVRRMLLLEFWNMIHPFDSFRAVPDYLLTVVCNELSRSPLETMKKRLEKLKRTQKKMRI